MATQSLSSLKSALPGESWRTLLQTFRTKVFLALSDDFSAKVASDLCGKDERLVPHYNLSESGQDARISVLTGRAAAHKSTISTSKSYAVQRDYVFEAKVFAELKNAQAIVLVYDGFNPRPPTGTAQSQTVLLGPQPHLFRAGATRRGVKHELRDHSAVSPTHRGVPSIC